jgi:hypothetical protein
MKDAADENKLMTCEEENDEAMTPPQNGGCQEEIINPREAFYWLFHLQSFLVLSSVDLLSSFRSVFGLIANFDAE